MVSAHKISKGLCCSGHKGAGKVKSKTAMWICFSFLCCFAASFAFMWLTATLTDGYFYLGDDSAQQNIAFMNAMAEALRSGNTIYAHSSELGSGFMDAYGYYGIGSPFFLLAVLFGVQDFSAVMVPFTAIKIGLCGVASYFFMKRYTVTEFGAFLGSLLYALSTYQLVNLYFHFVDSLVFFPLLILGLDMAMDGRHRWFFPFVVALATCTNAVFFFSEAVFLVLYFAVRLWNKDYKLTLKTFLVMAALTIVGLCLSGVVLLPTLISVLGNPRAGESFASIGKMLFLKPVQFAEIFRSLVFPAEFMATRALYVQYNPVQADLYIPLFGCVLWGAYVLENRKGFLAKLLLVSLVVALIPVTNSAFMMFSAEYYARWFFMPALFMAVATVKAYETRSLNLKKGFLLVGTFTVVFLGNVIWWHIRYGVKSVVDPIKFVYLVIVAIGGLVFCLLLRRIQRLRAADIMVAAIFLIFVVGTGFVNTYINKTAYMSSGFSGSAFFDEQPELPKAESEYRIDTLNSYINKGYLIGVSSINSFTSTVPSSVFEFYEGIGFTRTVRSNQSNRYSALRDLLSCKYIVVSPGYDGAAVLPEAEPLSDNGSYKVYENSNYIPMGFGYEYCIGESEFLTLDADIRDDAMMVALVLEDGETDTCGLVCVSADEIKELSKDYSSALNYHRNNACSDVIRSESGYVAKAELEHPATLFFSIPYSSGFTLLMDGQEIDAMRADFGFYAVPFDAGEHTLEFVFSQPGATAGTVLSVFGALGFAVVMFCDKRGNRKCRQI